MPEKGMLTNPDREIVFFWFDKNFPKGMPCICGALDIDWDLGETVVSPLVFTGAFNLGGPVYPQIQLTCSNCGHTRYFNAIYVGIMESESDSSPQKKEDHNVKQSS